MFIFGSGLREEEKCTDVVCKSHVSTEGHAGTHMHEVYIDAYGKVIPINTSSETNLKTVSLEGFKSNPIGKIEQWYRIDFYSTKMNQKDMKPIEGMSQTISSSMRGKIEFVVPTLDLNNPDYAYKITYLGRYK